MDKLYLHTVDSSVVAPPTGIIVITFARSSFPDADAGYRLTIVINNVGFDAECVEANSELVVFDLHPKRPAAKALEQG